MGNADTFYLQVSEEDFDIICEDNPRTVMLVNGNRQLPLAMPTGGWVPVWAGNPEESGRYLTSLVHSHNVPDNYSDVRIVFYHAPSNHWNVDDYYTIVAWQPLPECFG